MTTASETTQRELIGTKIGVVTGDKRDKTRTVEVDFQFRHPKYGKYIQRQLRFHIHDEHNTCKVGDRVEIAPCRPYSKTKSWRLLRVLQSAPEAE